MIFRFSNVFLDLFLLLATILLNITFQLIFCYRSKIDLVPKKKFSIGKRFMFTVLKKIIYKTTNLLETKKVLDESYY